MIEKLTSTSRSTEIDAVSFRMKSAYSSSGLDTDVHLQNMFTRLKSLSAGLTTAIKRSKAKSVLQAYDKNRKEQLRALWYLLAGLQHHPAHQVKEAAQKVAGVFKTYGLGIISKSYATRSSLIASLLNDLTNSTLQAAINQLTGCAEIIAALETSQLEFEEKRIAFETEKAKESTMPNATAQKEEVVKLINEKIVVYMRAMEIVEETTYGPFARTLHEIISDNNKAVKKRRKKTLNNESTESPPTEESDVDA